jgi:hypothetical protein
LNALVETEVIRGLLAPVGHGLWTAILGGFLFRASRGGAFRYSGDLLVAYLWVSVLHALWDSMNEIAVVVTFLLTGTPWQERLLEYGYLPRPTNEQVHLFTVLSNSGLVLVSALGITTLLLIWGGARE